MLAETPAEWLPRLTRRLDSEHGRLKVLESYVDGNAPLPELSKDTQSAWRDFQKEARTNWGLLIRDAVADRIVPSGLTVGGSVTSRTAKRALRIYRDNRMDQVIRTFLEYGLTYGKSYLTVWRNDEGEAVVTADSPMTMIAATDPLQPWRIRAALRIWRDYDEGKDYAVVWTRGFKQKFVRPCYSDDTNRVVVPRATGGWEALSDSEYTGAEPPVVVYFNAGEMGEFEAHIDVINRINREVLNQLTTTAMQAFKQRALEIPDREHPGLPQTDTDGVVIDYAKLFEPHPAALWNLPPGVKVWEGQATDIRPMLEAVKQHVRDLSAASKTPLPMLVPDNANQTAAGAENSEKSFIFKCVQRLSGVKAAVEAAMVKALEAEGVSVNDTLVVTFEDPARVLLSEKYQAAVNAKATGMAIATLQRIVLGMSPDEIAQDAVERARELESAKPAQTSVDSTEAVIDAEAVPDPESVGPTADNRLRETASPDEA